MEERTGEVRPTAREEFKLEGTETGRISGVTALGRRVTEFERIETFPKPEGLSFVELITDEVTSNCPVTGQPDFYCVTVRYSPDKLCAESKTAKLYFQQYRDKGLFCEAFASQIALDFANALGVQVSVQVVQKPRGGISIVANATRDPDPVPEPAESSVLPVGCEPVPDFAISRRDTVNQ